MWLTLQGETGKSIFKFPAQWTEAIRTAKREMTRTRPNDVRNAKVGIACLNWLCVDV
jgi:hypothetical protein